MKELASFSLIDEPWIPCLLHDGSACELGLREVLLRAHEIGEVRDASPPATVTIHRLLLAILHRVFGPASREEWARMWKAGQFDAGTLGDYLTAWQGRFDLFDPERPFYQDASIPDEAKHRGPLSLLQPERASGNMPTLFDHSMDEPGIPMAPSLAARAILVHQGYSLGGRGKGSADYLLGAPLLVGAVVLLRGDNLFRTLMLNLTVGYVPGSNIPMPSTSADRPRWELDDAMTFHQRAPTGLATVTLQDPMMAWRSDEKLGWRALRLGRDRALWRDSTALFRSKGTGDAVPVKALVATASLVLDKELPISACYSLDVLGLSSKQAKVFLWRHERMPLPLALLGDPDLLDGVREALDMADGCAGALWKALRRLAGILLVPIQGSGSSPFKVTRHGSDSLFLPLGQDASG